MVTAEHRTHIVASPLATAKLLSNDDCTGMLWDSPDVTVIAPNGLEITHMHELRGCTFGVEFKLLAGTIIPVYAGSSECGDRYVATSYVFVDREGNRHAPRTCVVRDTLGVEHPIQHPTLREELHAEAAALLDEIASSAPEQRAALCAKLRNAATALEKVYVIAGAWKGGVA